jgi:hypothetical protein
MVIGPLLVAKVQFRVNIAGYFEIPLKAAVYIIEPCRAYFRCRFDFFKPFLKRRYLAVQLFGGFTGGYGWRTKNDGEHSHN